MTNDWADGEVLDAQPEEPMDASDDTGMDWGRLAEEREFEIAGVRFIVSKLPAMQAQALWRRLLHEAAKTPLLDSLGRADMGNPAAAIVGIVKGVLLLEPSFVAQMQAQLFSHVEYLVSGMKKPRPLSGGEAVAFNELEPADVDEILVRVFLVNFFASLRRHASRLGAGARTSPSQSPEE